MKILFIILVLMFMSSCSDFNDYVVNISINGEIDSVYIDYKNHSTNVLLIKTSDEQIYYSPYHQYGGTPLFEYAEKGDSIIKKKGSDVFIIMRKNKIRKFKFKNED